MKRKFVLALAMTMALSSAAIAGERNTGELPFSPVPRNPESKAYQPFYGLESDRRQQQSPSGYQHDRGYNQSYQGERGRGHGGYGSSRGGHGGRGKR